jgi:hypothetical protein
MIPLRSLYTPSPLGGRAPTYLSENSLLLVSCLPFQQLLWRLRLRGPRFYYRLASSNSRSTTDADMVMKVQGQGGSGPKYNGVFDVVRHLYKEGGIRSIYRGTGATLARDGPGSAALVPVLLYPLSLLTFLALTDTSQLMM